MKKTFALCALLMLGAAARADNPIVWQSYNADPSARVFNGRLTIYPSHDRNDAQQYDMNDYHVYSSDDLKNWTDGGVILSAPQIPWVKPNGLPYALWAPDCIEKNGTYYFYFPAPAKTGGPRIGVATAPAPTGPFTAQPNYIEGPAGIDPGVFMDDDGQAYLYWAGAGCQAAKLAPDMLSIKGPIVKIAGAKNFFEGPSVIKRDGNYYLTYPAHRKGGSNDGGDGQNYDYAMGKNPLGPFEYKGTFSTSERGGNIHGSLVEFQGKWFCVYHDYSTSVGQPKSGFKRALRIDEIQFNADGTLAPLVWTTSGPPKSKNLNPFERVEAETLAQTDLPYGPHAIAIEKCDEGGADVGSMGAGDWLRYANADFGAGASSVALRVATPLMGSKIELRMDFVNGPIIGTCEVPNTGGWQNWQTVNCPITLTKGTRDLYLVVASDAQGDRLNLNWWQFAR